MSIKLQVVEQSGGKYIHVREGNTSINSVLMNECEAAYMAADLLKVAIKLLPRESFYGETINELIGSIEDQF